MPTQQILIPLIRLPAYQACSSITTPNSPLKPLKHQGHPTPFAQPIQQKIPTTEIPPSGGSHTLLGLSHVLNKCPLSRPDQPKNRTTIPSSRRKVVFTA